MSLVLEVKVLNDETRSLIGKDARPACDAHEKAFLAEIDKCRDVAKTEYLRAVYAHRFHNWSKAQQHIDRALQFIMEAFWRAEDTDREESQHEMLHRIAKWKHDNIGCWLVKSEDGSDTYNHRCSIFITHKRLGFSIGSTGDSICTICNKDAFECEHSKERSYWILGGKDEGGECQVCNRQSCTEHDEAHIYKICPGIRLKNQVLHEVSMVRRPAIPTARITSVPYSRRELEENVGTIDESIGMAYFCHLCAGACPGFTELESSPDRS